MKPEFAPPNILCAALRVLHCAAYTTRNWALDDQISRKQVYDLWEAIHEIPDLLTRWRGAESERELQIYLAEYEAKWRNPDLKGRYDSFLDDDTKE